MGLRCELPATERREIGKKNTSWSLVIVVWLLMPPLILLLSTTIATYYSSVSVIVGVAPHSCLTVTLLLGPICIMLITMIIIDHYHNCYCAC